MRRASLSCLLSRIERRRYWVDTVDSVRAGFLYPGWAVLVGRAMGQDVVEYGLIIVTIAVVVFIATVAFGSQIQPWFQGLAGRITTVGP
jgi:Flp pilus assembly pilin Flp